MQFLIGLLELLFIPTTFFSSVFALANYWVSWRLLRQYRRKSKQVQQEYMKAYSLFQEATEYVTEWREKSRQLDRTINHEHRLN